MSVCGCVCASECVCVNDTHSTYYVSVSECSECNVCECASLDDGKLTITINEFRGQC